MVFRGEPDLILEPITKKDKPEKTDNETKLIHEIENIMIGKPFNMEEITRLLYENVDKSLLI
jgi:hypothetical protein